MTEFPSAASATVTALPRRHRGAVKLTRDLALALRPEAKSYDVRDSEVTGFFVRVETGGTKTFYVEVARGKRIKIGRADVLKVHVARERAKQMLGNVANNRDPWEGIRTASADDGAPALGVFVAGTDPDELDVRKWTGDYSTAYRASARSERSHVENMRALRTVYALWWALPLTEITPGMLETLKVERKRKHGNSNATVRRDLTRLMGVFRLARKRGFVNDAFEHVELPDVDPSPKVRFLSDAERKRLNSALLLAATPSYLRCMVTVSLNTGLRRGELFALTWDCIDFERGVLTVAGATSKTNRTRHVPLNKTAIAALKSWKPKKDASGLVFVGTAGKFWTCKKSWASLLERAEITDFRWHDQRHDFASRLVMGGVELFTVGALLGHDRIDTSMRYAHLSRGHKSAAVEVLDDA